MEATMGTKGKEQITIDLAQFKMHVRLRGKIEVSLHFDSPSRRFYLSVIALLVHEMQRLGRVTSIPLSEHQELLTLLNETVGGSAGSSGKETLLPRIYKKWKSALPDLENAPLFRVLGKTKEFGEASGKSYSFSDELKDFWANLFEYKGSGENVRLRFSLDKLGVGLDDIVVVYGEEADQKAADGWERFLETLKRDNFQEQVKEAVPEKSPGETPSIPVSPRKWTDVRLRDLKVAVPVLAALFVVVVILWRLYSGSPTMEPASVNKMAFPLPDKPSIAVLPFVNMSGDPAQDYLCDGITEEIITALSKCPFLFVIARNSTFTYKGKPEKVQQVAEDLGVRYVMEGSVRKAGDLVRITVQFDDAISGTHVWAERYERDAKDIFKMQDDITARILSALKIRLTEGERSRVRSKSPGNLDAYLKYLQAREYQLEGSPSYFALAKRTAEEAIALDPEFTGGYRTLGWVYLLEMQAGLSESPKESLRLAHELALKICTMDDSDPLNHGLMGIVYLHSKDLKKAISEMRRSVELDPNSARAHFYLAWALSWENPEEAVVSSQKAIRLNPLDQRFLSMCSYRSGLAYTFMEKYEMAVAELEISLKIRPNQWNAILFLIASDIYTGQEDKAQVRVKELLRLQPKFSIEEYVRNAPFEDEALKERMLRAWGKAGLK
jgi:adenylate cyclase